MIQLSFLTMISQEGQYLTDFIKILKERKLQEMFSINQPQKIRKLVNLFYNLHTYLLILAYLFMKKILKLINQPYWKENN